MRTWLLVMGLLTVLAVVLCGAWFAPHDVTEVVGVPWSGEGLLGTDVLGRDVLSRLLAGGAGLLAVAVPAGLAASLLGTIAGLAATWTPWVERLVLRTSAGMLAVPGLLVVLTCAVALPAWAAVLAGMVLLGTPLSARVVHAAATPLRRAGFVLAAVVRGERPRAVLTRELLPVVGATVLSDAGLRVVAAVQLTVAVHALGLGPQPPAPDWAVMIRENLPGVALNPWSVLAPAVAVAALTAVLLLGLDLLGTRIVPRTVPRRHAPPPPGPSRPATGVVELRGVTVESEPGVPLFAGLDLTVAEGEIVGLVGPSGVGKTSLLRLLLGDVRPGARVVTGQLLWHGEPVVFGSRAARRWRRAHVGLLPQDPAATLDPLRRVGSVAQADVLARLGLPSDIGRRHPHALSGGQAQRVVLARALAADPDLLLLDEPTSGLDAATRRLVTEEITVRRRSTVIVTHDLRWARSVCDRVVELRHGVLVPAGETSTRPRTAVVEFGAPVLRLEDVAVARRGRELVHGVDLELRRGELLVLVGPSGAGKSTLLHAVAGLHPVIGRVEARGTVALLGQDPVAELNPVHSLGSAVARPLRLAGLRRREARDRAVELLAEVGLGPEFADRRPGECSGGQRQRAALARALASDPDVLLADEPTSALDATTADAVLEVLDRRRAVGLAVFFVTHDEDVAARADRVFEVADGRCAERVSM
ncbi:ABC transporter ATP-binding protein/permease [Saccharothrix sp. ALI-22-I]|uniref:ABC transporter ATP-binding protein/permease n=1 Tax=Saccharothrix sp. ALI-22-I TaxID=1933778 RepID=UPI000A066E2C|nr:ATP-binding cassette domain-containing protein [Saccharothrix sp. ALI-22-I]